MGTAGRIWKFGSDIDTDTLAPGRYMGAPVEVIAAHCLEAVNPGFAANVRPGDILVAGSNFGAGSSREQAVEALRHLGIVAIVANSFAGIFYRNAVNLGMPVLECKHAGNIDDGMKGSIDARTGLLSIEGQDAPLQCTPLPNFLMAIINDGGLVPHLEKRFHREATT